MASLTRQAAVISGIFSNKAVQQHCLRLLSGTTYKRTMIFHKPAKIYILIYALAIYSSTKNFIFIPSNTVSILCRVALWNCFRERILTTRNFLITNKRSDNVSKTMPWCSSTQSLPSLTRSLKIAKRDLKILRRVRRDFLNTWVVLARESASFWRENVVTVVILLILARMS